MYKVLLCWRYLLTRYLALACIISVMLGVATLIVVNSVMGGFSTKLKDRLHALLCDVLVEAASHDGFPDPEGKMRRIRESPIGDRIEAMTPTLEVFAMLQFQLQGETVTRPVRLIGVDPEGRTEIGGFKEYLTLQKEKAGPPSFELQDEQARARLERQLRFQPDPDLDRFIPRDPNEPPPPDPPPSSVKIPEGVIVGHAIAHIRAKQPPDSKERVEDIPLLHPGSQIILTTVSGQKLAPVYDRFVVCDYFKSEMSEYDSNYVFVPLKHLQKLRTMENRVTSIQIKLKDYRDAKLVVDELARMFPTPGFQVETWEQKQGALLAAISVEKGILNILLFLIICVAGFGILAIFAMIVVEKTRDIGILKALGASNGGVMKIFLGYGLLLGVMGAGLGTFMGLAITIYINTIDKWIGNLTGRDLFPKDIYYFSEIPTDIQTLAVVLVNFGAVAIAVGASVLPALKAAMLHPVRALRYE